MSLRKIWTTQYQRVGRASYAEANDPYIDVTVAQIIAFMADPTSRFYKIEIIENGAFVGYFIIRGGYLVKYNIRPHFLNLENEFFGLANQTIAAGNTGSTNI